MKKMSAAKAKAISEPGRYNAGETLYLLVSDTGAKSWVQRLVVHGRRHDIGLGSFRFVTLAEAREQAFENQRTARRGGDPVAAKAKAKVPDFREAAMRTHEGLAAKWRNGKVSSNWIQQLERHAMKRLGNIPVDKITRNDVMAALSPIWTTKPEAARRVRGCIRATLAWAQASGYVDINMAGEMIDAALPSMRSKRKNLRSLPYGDVPGAIQIIRNSGASIAAKSCLEFVILTACRNGEARNATWSEIDLDKRLWTIPGERMKTGKEHRQPLSDAAIEVLISMQALGDKSGLIFPSSYKRGKPLSDMALTKLLRDNGLADKATVHGFRACFRSWAGECTGADHAVMELSLAHHVGDRTERAYARGDLLAKRRILMDQWGAYSTGNSGQKVVKLHR